MARGLIFSYGGFTLLIILFGVAVLGVPFKGDLRIFTLIWIYLGTFVGMGIHVALELKKPKDKRKWF